MEKTVKMFGIGAAIALMSVIGIAYAEVSSVDTEVIPWVTGESIHRTTINGVCGESNVHKIQFTYFDDYVHVLKIENGDYDIQRYYDNSQFPTVAKQLLTEVLFC